MILPFLTVHVLGGNASYRTCTYEQMGKIAAVCVVMVTSDRHVQLERAKFSVKEDEREGTKINASSELRNRWKAVSLNFRRGGV